jgi:ferredoxin
MRILIDLDLCQGHAMCAEEAPEVFAVDARGQLTVLQAEPPPSQHEAVRRACRYCPTGAISLDEGAP